MQKMRKAIFIFLFLSAACAAGYAQEVTPTPEPTVVVTQSFVDDATKAFREVIPLRQAAIEAKDTIGKQKVVISELKQIIADYASADIADAKKRKSIWKRIGEKALKLLDLATDPETLAEIAKIVILAKAASR